MNILGGKMLVQNSTIAQSFARTFGGYYADGKKTERMDRRTRRDEMGQDGAERSGAERGGAGRGGAGRGAAGRRTNDRQADRRTDRQTGPGPGPEAEAEPGGPNGPDGRTGRMGGRTAGWLAS